jgi:hypothetical protein
MTSDHRLDSHCAEIADIQVAARTHIVRVFKHVGYPVGSGASLAIGARHARGSRAVQMTMARAWGKPPMMYRVPFHPRLCVAGDAPCRPRSCWSRGVEILEADWAGAKMSAELAPGFALPSLWRWLAFGPALHATWQSQFGSIQRRVRGCVPGPGRREHRRSPLRAA